jgi:hypothetical protein
MNCAVHAEQEASNFCRNCGKAMCTACARTVQGVAYCEDCLASVMGHGRPAAAAAQGIPQPAGAHGGPVPGLAFALGFCPGLGAVYNGEYAKALVHIVIFGTIIAGFTSGLGAGANVALALFLTAFIFYMAIDALHVAQAKRGGPGGAAGSADPFQAWGKGKPVGAIILIGLGVFFLLCTFDVISWDRMGDLWPVFLIGAGILMLWNRLGRSS